MAKELQVAYGLTGRTLYSVLRNAVGQAFNQSGPTFETYATANLSLYAITMTEQGVASRFYVGNMPTIAAGIYDATAYDQVGGSPAEGDQLAGFGPLQWNGTALLSEYAGIFAVGNVSGGVPLASGQLVSIYSGQLSGQVVNLLSGNSVSVWSGTQVNTFSGQVFTNSGHASLLLSGGVVSVYSGQLSGQPLSIASGTTFLSSGQFVQILSGATVALFSGQQVGIVSGTFVNTYSGGVFLASGVPLVGGKAWVNALNIIAAGVAGRSSGANTGSELYDGLDGITHLTATIDASGNRTATSYP